MIAVKWPGLLGFVCRHNGLIKACFGDQNAGLGVQSSLLYCGCAILGGTVKFSAE